MTGEFASAPVLITGGMGFIGSNLARRLLSEGAEVVVADCADPGLGANPFNLEGCHDRIRLIQCDVRDRAAIVDLVRGRQFVFHLAGVSDHHSVMNDPFTDLDINLLGTAAVLEACRRHCPEARIVFTGTRGEYGRAPRLPADESTPPDPLGFYELSSWSAGQLCRIYHRVHGVRVVVLRIGNVYGPRAQMRDNRSGVANWFLRLAMDDQEVPLFGDGTILRDLIYVDDLVEALLLAAVVQGLPGQVFNIGGDEPVEVRQIAQSALLAAGSGRCCFVPFSRERTAVEPGDYWSDIRRFQEATGWTPHVTLDEGMRRTAQFYLQHRDYYW
jgi:UDP-glucose 4-epimerase